MVKIIVGFVYSMISVLLLSNSLLAQRGTVYTKNIIPLKNNFSNMPGFFDTYLVEKQKFYFELPTLSLQTLITPISTLDYGLDDNTNVGFNPLMTLLSLGSSKFGSIVKLRSRVYGDQRIQEVMTLYGAYLPFKYKDTANVETQQNEDSDNKNKLLTVKYLFFSNNFGILFSPHSILTAHLMAGRFVLSQKDLDSSGVNDQSLLLGVVLAGASYYYVMSPKLTISATMLLPLSTVIEIESAVGSFSLSDKNISTDFNLSMQRIAVDWLVSKNWICSLGIFNLRDLIQITWISVGVNF